MEEGSVSPEKKKSRAFALSLSFMIGGLGHFYLGRPVKAIVFLLLALALLTVSLILIFHPLYQLLSGGLFNGREFLLGILLHILFLLFQGYCAVDVLKLYREYEGLSRSSAAPRRFGLLTLINLFLFVVILLNSVIIYLLVNGSF